MSVYRVEKRDAGWKRYRVAKVTQPLLGNKVVEVVAEFYTERGAEKWIRLQTWTPAGAERPPMKGAATPGVDDAEHGSGRPTASRPSVQHDGARAVS